MLPRNTALVTALVTALAATTAAASGGDGKLAVLDEKNGFRDAKLGADVAGFAGLAAAGKRGDALWFTRATDKLALFETKLARIAYGFRDAKLDTIVITGAWTLDPKLSLCEGNNDHIGDNLRKVFGKPTATHAYSSSEGKRCVREHSGGLTSPYCHVLEWRSARVRLSFFAVMTTAAGAPPPDVVRDEGWTGHSCRFVLEYARVADPATEL